MRLLKRTPRPQPAPVDPAAVAEGLRTFAADLTAGDALARDMVDGRAEMPFTPAEWAAYPALGIRRARIAYFGEPGPGEIPAADLDRLLDEPAA
jgi:hypothetical protein